MKKKVLVFGSLPKWKGGIHKTGLATGIFDLHDAVNSLGSEFEITIAASDVYVKQSFVDNTPIIGWSKKSLFFHALKRFYRIPLFVKGAWGLRRYSQVVSALRTIVKLIFLDYAIDMVNPDIVHLHGCLGAYYRSFIWNKELPVVLRIHGINGYDSTIHGSLQYQEMERRITKLKFEFVTFVTTGIYEEWKEKYGKFNCPMVPLINGYNSNVFFPSKDVVEKKYDLITFSGLQERKGQDRVLQAIKRLSDEGKSISYLIIGSGNKVYEEKLRNYSSQNNLQVDFIGYCPQDQINRYLWMSRYFILPSVTEGFGKVFVESIAAGIPVILPRTLPIAQEENLLNYKNSIFLNDETVENIYTVIRNLPDNGNDSLTVSSSISHLSWQNLAKKYLDLYRLLYV